MNVVAMRNIDGSQDVQVVPKVFYTVQEVQTLLGIKTDKAYKIIRRLREELVEKGYAEYPAGKVPKKYFLERYFMNEKEADYVLQRVSRMRGESRSGREV